MRNVQGKKGKGKGGRQWTYPISFIRAVVREYELSHLSMNQLAQKHGVTLAKVSYWVTRFSSELAAETPALMTPEEQRQLKALQKENEELQKKLNLANLKITGLEMMIDVAEDELNIDIRKKPGTKQSEG